MKYNNLIECAYLPDIQQIEDDSNLQELNEAYNFAVENKCRSFCTHLSFISFIERKNYPTRLVPVIDFPKGYNSSESKLFDAGIAYRTCQKASASELDVVLHSSFFYAKEDIIAFTKAKISEKIGIKYIIELGYREEESILGLLRILHKKNCKFVKTNTGKMEPAINFNEKLKLVDWLSKQTQLPIKVSGNIKTVEQLEEYKQILGPHGIYGIGYHTLKTW